MDSIYGLPLATDITDNRTLMPISALVIVKCIDENGDEICAVYPTEGMSVYDSVGLIRFAQLYVESVLRRVLDESTKEESTLETGLVARETWSKELFGDTE